jgi:CheY-like chemotaxis protein
VVVVSATAMPGEVDDVLARGVSGYLTKPLDIRRFLETLDVLLEAGPRRAGGAGMGGAA